MEVDNEGSSDDPTMSTLLAMSEYYLSLTPQNIQEAVRCLLAVLSLKPPPRIEAKTRLKLGLLFYHHTNNLLEAREQLDQAALVTQSAANLEEIRFEATSVSTRILVEQRSLPQAKSLIRSKLDNSTRHPYWHMRLLLQLADIHVCERDERGVVSVLDRCVDYARQVDASYARLLCMLYKGAFLLTHHRYPEAGEVLNQTSSVMEGYHGDKENLIRTFYLVIQVSHLLMAGQVKTAKPHLKQLQQRVKLLSTEPSGSSAESSSDGSSGDGSKPLTADSIQWLTKEQTFVIVYLVSVMHSVMSGYTDKALSYADKAFQFMNVSPKTNSTGVESVLRAHLLEHTIVCLLMQGKPNSVTDKLEEVITVCHDHPQLVFSHRAVLHTLLGLYAFTADRLDKAISQFHTALQHTNDNNLRVFITLNLAVSYMKEGRGQERELAALMKSLEGEVSPTSCLSLKASLHYVRGLYSYTELKLHDAKRHLRETLVMSNKCDLNKLTACSLILLGQIFLSVGNTKETMDMVCPAMQLAQKIPDKKLQAWAASLLADLYHLTGQGEKESAAREQCTEVEKTLRQDQTPADQSKHNTLLQWTVGDWPIAKKPASSDDVGQRPQDIGKLATPLQAPPTTHHNMLSQHSSQPSTSKRKVASSGHASSSVGHVSSSSNDPSRKISVESMEVDRPHPIAESATPTHLSTTPTHSSKGHKDKYPLSNVHNTGSHSDEMLTQQNGSAFTVPNGKKHLALKLDNTPVKGSPSRRHSISKSPEVRLTKVTSPTGKLLSGHPAFSSENNSNRAPNSQETKSHQLLQSQGSQDQLHGGGGVEFNSLWMGSGLSSQSQDQNFLPSFDSDMAFQQLSLSPSLHMPPPHQSKVQQGQRSLEHHHHHQRGQRPLERHQQQLPPGQRSLTQQQIQQQQQHYHQDVQQQRHQRESPLMRGAPPPVSPQPLMRGAPPSESPQPLMRGALPPMSPQPLMRGAPPSESPQPLMRGAPPPPYHQPQRPQASSSPTPSAFSTPPLQHPLSTNAQHSSSLHGQRSPEKQRTQAFQQQPQSMDVVHSQQQRSPNIHHHHHKQPQQQVQHGFNRGPQQQQKQQPSGVERQTTGGGSNTSAATTYSPVSGMNTSMQPQRASEPQQLSESLSIPTLHDLHNDLQQQRMRSPLGIPPFHQIQLHQNSSSPQSVQSMDMTSSNSNSPMLSSIHLQNPSPLHPGPSVSPHSASGRSRSPHTHTHTGGHISPLHQRLTPSSQQQSQQQQQVRTSISPLHQQARHISPIQQPSPPALIQQHSLQTQQGSQQHQLQQQQAGLPQQDMLPPLHQIPQHPSPKRHQLPQVNLQAQNQQNSIDNSSMLNLTPQAGQFSSPIQQQQQPPHLSPQKIHLYSSPQQQHRALLQQQQQLLQLQQAQAQAQRQFILQQHQQRQRQSSPSYIRGSSGAQPYFSMGGGGAAMLNATASSNKQLMHAAHPQLTHLSVLQGLGHDMDRSSANVGPGASVSSGNLLNQQSVVMGVNPYATTTSFGQGLPLLPNGTAAVPGGTGVGYQQPGQNNMGGPLRHFHSQGR